MPSGSAIDTSFTGVHAFTVTATDALGSVTMGSATYTVAAPSPPPSATVVAQPPSVGATGAVTVKIVPGTNGTATLTLSVPTASVVRCRRGTAKIKGRCRPVTTVIGVVHKTGLKGIKLTVTVTPNRRVRSLLAHGRTLHATATLTFKSAVGVKPYVKTWRVTLRVRKRH